MSKIDFHEPVVEADGRIRLTTMPKDSRTRARAIKKCILNEEAAVRKQHPWLQYQNAIGLFWWLSSLVVICTAGWAYLTGKLEWYYTIPLMALPISILHELEHDLIHNLYFRKQKWVQNVMFALIWVFKFHGNPWWRRDIHHWHHRVSGQINDIEERILGLGMECDWKRLGVTAHPLGFLYEVKNMKRDAGDAFDLSYMNRTSMATASFIILLIKSFPIMVLGMYLLPEWAIEASYMNVLFPPVRDFMVLLVFPLVLRQSSLVAMSTGSHYYGDIPPHDAFFQNQILDHWTLFPLQLFCWFFGATHIIHHYIPNQPFYLRSLISKNVHTEMIKQGVRKNDWGMVWRANRWNIYKGQEENEHWRAAVWYISVFTTSFAMVFVWDIFIAKISLLLLTRFLTWPIYRHMAWYKKKVANRTKLVGVPKVY